jgi:hypothetical protein
MGSILTRATGLLHDRRQNAFAEEVSRSPTAKGRRIIYNENNERKNKGGTKRSGRESD